MRSLALAMLAAFAAAANGSHAADPAELAKKYACLACHAVDKKVVGPSYKEVAAKYKSDKTAEAKLIDKVKKGGSGVWGPVPMPPNTTLKEEDIKTLVQWILSQK